MDIFDKMILEGISTEEHMEALHDDHESDMIDSILKPSEIEQNDEVEAKTKIVFVPAEDEDLEFIDLKYSEEELEDIDDGLSDVEHMLNNPDHEEDYDVELYVSDDEEDLEEEDREEFDAIYEPDEDEDFIGDTDKELDELDKVMEEIESDFDY